MVAELFEYIDGMILGRLLVINSPASNGCLVLSEWFQLHNRESSVPLFSSWCSGQGCLGSVLLHEPHGRGGVGRLNEMASLSMGGKSSGCLLGCSDLSTDCFYPSHNCSFVSYSIWLYTCFCRSICLSVSLCYFICIRFASPLSVFISPCLHIFVCLYLSVYVSVSLFVSVSMAIIVSVLFVFPSLFPFIYLFFSLSVVLCVGPCLFVFCCIFLYLSLCLFLCWSSLSAMVLWMAGPDLANEQSLSPLIAPG